MSHFDEQRETILKEYFELLRFPTVGAEPTRLKDCVDCAMWLKQWLTPQGFAVELMQAPKMLGTPPILLAERKGPEGAPTVGNFRSSKYSFRIASRCSSKVDIASPYLLFNTEAQRHKVSFPRFPDFCFKKLCASVSLCLCDKCHLNYLLTLTRPLRGRTVRRVQTHSVACRRARGRSPPSRGSAASSPP